MGSLEMTEEVWELVPDLSVFYTTECKFLGVL